MTVLALAACAQSSTAPPGQPLPLVDLAADYPLQLGYSPPGALLHWLDSLAGISGAGLTGGKTQEAHRRDYRDAFGEPGAAERALLDGFAELRRRFAAERPGGGANDLALAFFEAPSLEQALEQAGRRLDARSNAHLRAAVLHFQPLYQKLWDDGRQARDFVERARRDPLRERLGQFLAEVARFYGVTIDTPPYPHLVVVPVREGYGTHAQALGHLLLVEVRPGERLIDEIEPIIHENAHYLYQRMSAERRQALRLAAAGATAGGLESWYLLQEALPTALAQGVAGERFLRGRWSAEGRWYHNDRVDHYAKTIFPLVRRALDEGARFDENLVRRLVVLDPTR